METKGKKTLNEISRIKKFILSEIANDRGKITYTHMQQSMVLTAHIGLTSSTHILGANAYNRSYRQSKAPSSHTTTKRKRKHILCLLYAFDTRYFFLVVFDVCMRAICCVSYLVFFIFKKLRRKKCYFC